MTSFIPLCPILLLTPLALKWDCSNRECNKPVQISFADVVKNYDTAFCNLRLIGVFLFFLPLRQFLHILTSFRQHSIDSQCFFHGISNLHTSLRA